MENTDQTNNADIGNAEHHDFKYVTEHVRPKSGKRVKKVVSIIALSFLAAVIFGVTERLVFGLTDELISKEAKKQNLSDDTEWSAQPEQRSTVVLEEKNLRQKPVSEQSVSEQETELPEQDVSKKEGELPNEETVSQVTGTPAPVSMVTAGNQENGQPDVKTETNAGSETASDQGPALPVGQISSDEGNTQSPLELYASMIGGMRTLADEVSHSLVRVRAITSGINWLDESIESVTEFTGIVMGDNSIELLVLTKGSKIVSADRIEVLFEDGSVAAGAVYGYYDEMDIAVVSALISEIPMGTFENVSYMPIGASGSLTSGEPVMVVGTDSLSFGFVTSTGKRVYVFDNVAKLINTDISYRYGSDGAVVNLSGELIGLITDSLGDPNDYVCSMVGTDSIRNVTVKMLNNITIPYTGIRAENIPAAILDNMGIPNGIYVNEVAASSPAVTSGIRKGDVILSVNGTLIGSVEEYSSFLMEREIDEKLVFEVYRSSLPTERYIEITVRVAGKQKG